MAGLSDTNNLIYSITMSEQLPTYNGIPVKETETPITGPEPLIYSGVTIQEEIPLLK